MAKSRLSAKHDSAYNPHEKETCFYEFVQKAAKGPAFKSYLQWNFPKHKKSYQLPDGGLAQFAAKPADVVKPDTHYNIFKLQKSFTDDDAIAVYTTSSRKTPAKTTPQTNPHTPQSSMAPEDPATSTAADVPKGVAPVADAMAEVEAKEEVPQRALVEEKKGKEIAGKTPQLQKGFSFLMPALFRNAKTNEQKVAMLQNMLDDVGEPNQPIPLPNVSHKSLQRVLEYCLHHKDDLPSLGDDDKDSSPSSRKRTDDIDEWDEHFMPMEDEIKELFALILAAHYLDIKPLLDLGCKTVANMIRGKSPEQIREMFNIENVFQAEDCSIIKNFLMGLLDGRDAVIGLDFCDGTDLNIPGVETSKLDVVKNIYNWADSVLLTSNTASSSKSHTEIQTLDFLKSYLPTGIAKLGFGDDSDLGSATIAAAAESASETGLTASILPTGVSDIFEPDALSDVFGNPFDKGACLAAFCCPREELTAADTTGDTTDTDNEASQANSDPIANRAERPRKRGREEVVRGGNGPAEKTPKGMKGWIYLLEEEENSRGALYDANNPIAFDIDTPMTTRRSSRVAHQRHKLLPSQIRKMPAPSVSSVVDMAAPSAEEVFTSERAYLARFQKQSHQFYLKSTFFDDFPIAVTNLRLCQMVVQELQAQLDDAVRAKKGLEKRVEELTHELEDGVESVSALVEAKKRLERELEDVREWLEETEDSSAALQKKASGAADCDLSPDAERLLEDEDEIKELDAGKRAAVAAADSVADDELSQNDKRLLADKIEEQKASFDGLCKQIKEILGEKVEKVVISNRTIVVIGPENQLADTTLRDSSMSSYMVSKKTLELNPNDPSVQYLKTKVDADKNDKTVRDLTYVLLAAATINSEHCKFAGTDKGAQVEEVPLLEYQKDVLNLAVRLADTDGTEGELWKLLSEMDAENEKGRLLLSALDLFREKLHELLDCADGDMLDDGGQVFSADAEDGFM